MGQFEIYFATSFLDSNGNPIEDPQKTSFNGRLATRLEQEGFKVFYHPSDGFSPEDLKQKLKEKGLPEDKIVPAVDSIRYHYHMGIMIPKTDIFLVPLNEPITSDIDVRTRYARTTDRFLVAYKTDLQDETNLDGLSKSISPYLLYEFRPRISTSGKRTNSLVYVSSKGETEEEIKSITEFLKQKTNRIPQNMPIPDYAKQNPNLTEVLHNAQKRLFRGIKDIHSPESLEEIAKRFVESQDTFRLHPSINFVL